MIRLVTIPILLGATLFLWGCGGHTGAPPAAKPPLVVVSDPVVSDHVRDYEDFTGRTEAYRFVEVRPQVTGYLQKIEFRDGSEVTEGRRLFVIDQRTFKAARDQAKAALKQAQTRLRTMERNYQRAEELHQQRGSISQEDYDRALGDRDEAREAVGVARANLRTAEINLDYTEVKAPLSGRVGRRLVDPGNTVQAYTTPLTTIVFLDKIYVTFEIDERTFLRLRELMKRGEIGSAQDNRIKVQLGLANGKSFPLTGEIDFEDNQVDLSTGTYRLRAVVDNPILDRAVVPDSQTPRRDRLLSPGLYVRVRFPVGQPHRGVLVPEGALGNDQGQKFLYVVNRQNVVEYRKVKAGRAHHGLREILKPDREDTVGLKKGEKSGVSPGERIIIRGLQKVQPKAKVTPRFEKTPVPPELRKPVSVGA
jgi:RND family efflux transporter MFP subunit